MPILEGAIDSAFSRIHSSKATVQAAMSTDHNAIVQEISLLRNRLQSLEYELTETPPSQEQISQTLHACYADLDRLESVANQFCFSPSALDAILSSANAAITSVRIFANHDWEYEYYSDQVETVFGFSPAEFNANKSLWMSRIHPEDLETVILPSYETVFAEQTISRKYRFLHKDGTWRWIADTLLSRRDDTVNGWRLTNVATNITPQIEQEEALQTSEKQFRTLVENVPGAVCRCDAFTWQDVYMSDAIEAIIGYCADDVVHRFNYITLIHPDDIERVKQAVKEAIAIKQPYNIDYRVFHKNGSVKWVNETGQGVWSDHGELLYLDGVILDITDRKQAEIDLRTSEEYYRLLAEAQPHFLWTTTSDGTVQYCNQYWFDYTGLTLEETNYYGWLEPVHPHDVQRVIELWETALATSKGYSIEYRVRRASDNAYRWFYEQVSPIRDELGNIQVWTGTATEIHDRKQAEEALRDSEERFRQLAENIEQVFWMVQLEGQKLLYINPACEALWSYSQEEFYNKNPTLWFNSIHPDDRALLLTAIKKSYQGIPTASVYRIFRADGEMRWLQERTFPVRNAAGQAYRLVGISEDITERKQAEEALQESEERFRQLAENIEQVFCMIAADTFELLYISPACKAMWGYDPEEFYDADRAVWFNSIHPDDRALIQSRAERNQNGETAQITYRITRVDGEMRWIEERTFPVYNATGQVYRVIGISEDITERKQAEEALRESEARFRQLAESIREVFFIETADFQKTLYVSPAFAEIWGYSYEELYQEPVAWVKAIHPDDRPAVLQALNPTDLNVPTAKEYRIIKPDGSIRWIFSRTFPIVDETGTVIRQVGVSEDITDRKHAEEQIKASLREKEVLLSEVHHRVKNNLQLITSMLDLQAMRIDEPQTYQALQDSQNRIRAIAKVHESLYQAHNFAEINLSNYIQSLANDLFNTYSISRTISLNVHIPETLSINLDKAIPCGLILNELIANALKHGFQSSRAGQVYVTLQATALHRLTLSVGNTGDTLPPNFDLAQVRSLGLQLVNALVEQIEGICTVHRSDRTLFEVSFDI